MDIFLSKWRKTIDFCILQAYNQNKFSGIVEGKCGLILLYAQLYQIYKEEYYLKKVYELTDHIMETNLNNYSLGYGVAGIAWTINSLKDFKLFANMDDWFIDVDQFLEQEYFNAIQNNNMDYFEGAAGILFYFLERKNFSLDKMDKYIKNFCDYIRVRLNQKDWIELKFDRKRNEYYKVMNLGVPHGLTGILLILLLIKEKTPFNTNYLIMEVINLIFSFEIKSSPYICHFPYIYKNDNTKVFSTIGWCFGDLMVGYALLKAGIILRNEYYFHYGEKILIDTIPRENQFKEKLILCHGFTSLAYIYENVYYKTKNNIFKTRSIYYQKKSIELFEVRYQKYIYDNNDIFFKNPSLFAGYSGFFLSLLSWNYNHVNNWLNCLLL
ncbi:lanthionine synthetase LanC family protein [Parabacteroides pacaensis]|uniref:lanthionine synthetase LanC family protein n=1 Tax=Parabacteroides pacaensis TaxID=2086575 RepID=UPI000D1023A8|nr:lanthionine synthetase LanC family protein [Parabacteroides pacaensis]